MTIKQIFDILETYNECCYLCNEPSNCKKIKFYDDSILRDTFSRYYEFVDTVQQWYRPEYLEMLLSYEFFTPGKEATINWTDIHGNKHENGKTTISFINRY